MKPHTVEAVKRLIARRSESLSSLSLSWFGGEPLLAKDVVLSVSGYAAERALNSKSKLKYSASITTNAYLLDEELFRKLVDVGVRHYQITLDGPAAVHDRTRRRAAGGGTFDRIWTNLLMMKDSSLPFTVTLRLHFTTESLDLLPPLLADIRTVFLPDSRFTPALHEVKRHGGANDWMITPMTSEQRDQAELHLNRLLGTSFDERDSSGYICYAARANSLLIRADGTIGKCTVALSDSRNAIGHINDDGTLHLLQQRVGPWLRGIATLDPLALECPLAGMPPE
jgi:uncharacterized protein